MGCFDGKLLNHFNKPPSFYHGFDAGWEDGLEQAKKNFQGRHDVAFTKSSDPLDLLKAGNRPFDLAVMMETIEHVAPDEVDKYIASLASITSGHLIITVPNEIGIFSVCKSLAKKCMKDSKDDLSMKDVFNAMRKRSYRINRREHKGFNHEVLIGQLSAYFEIISVEGMPRGMPLPMSFTIGIIARSKK